MRRLSIFEPGIKSRNPSSVLILADGVESESDSSSVESAVPNNAFLNALAKGYVWQQQIEAEQFEGLDDLAKEQGVDRSYVGRMLQLTSLAPDIVESIQAGQAFADISLQHCRKGIPVFWEEQRRTLLDARFGVGVTDGLL